MIAHMSDPTGVVLRRYAQFIVDRLLVTVPAMVLLLFCLHFAVREHRAGGPSVLLYLTLAPFLLVLVAGNWFTEVWLPHRWLGGTPAMRWFGLRIVTERGEAPTLRAYTIRWLLAVVDGYFFGLVGALTIALSRRHQRVGDMAARTLVVRRTADQERPAIGLAGSRSH